jgi:hypothetical protein
MTNFSRSMVEGFKAFERLEKTEPGFKLHPAFLRVKGLMLAMAEANLSAQEQAKLREEWDDAERELFGRG